MNSEFQTRNSKLKTIRAFTLIELLVVIAVIAILAGLLFTALPAVNASRMRSVARSELAQITTAIEGFKADYGSYPQDNKLNVAVNPLYYELVGMIVRNTPAPPSYVSLDGSYAISINTVTNTFKISGLVNSWTSAGATDDHAAIKAYLKELKAAQLGTNNAARILICSADDSPWKYNSSNPTNNPGSYDLWIDLVLNGKTNRISNWGR
jgi:prepilin-type N-terminal cleavage/methylation domain-containing protein